MISGAEALVAPTRINPIYLEGKLLPLAASTAAELNLHDGQVVQALVRLSGDQPTLLLKGRLIDGPPASMAQVGESMWLRVQSRPEGPWNLMPVPAPAGSAAPVAVGGGLPALAPTPLLGDPNAAPVVSRIANLLYRPTGAVELTQLYQPGTLDALLQTVPRPDLQAQWRGLQLSMAQLTPAALRQAMNGAMGAEVWLARGLPPMAQDPKQLLRRLIDAITQSQGAVMDDPSIEGFETSSPVSRLQKAVDDLEASQVQAVQAQAQREVLFSMTLPFADANPVELTIRRGPKQDGESPLLTINVHSKSEDLGPVWLQTQLHSAEQVDLIMWAESHDVVQQAREKSSLLGQDLGEAGLTMRSFQVMHGPRPAQATEWTPSGRGLVVDVSA